MPLSAALPIEPPGNRDPLYISRQRCSIRNGSWPISQPLKSWITAIGRRVGADPVGFADPVDVLVGQHLDEDVVAVAEVHADRSGCR